MTRLRLLLIICVLFLCNQDAATATTHRILLAGASNMVGHTTDEDSLSTTMWDELVQVLDSTTASRVQIHGTVNALYAAACEAREWSTEAECEISSYAVTDGVMDLYARGALLGLRRAVPGAVCTYQGNAVSPLNGTAPLTGAVLEPTPVSFDSGCGRTFGHEFPLARSLWERGMYGSSSNPLLRLDKVAVDETSLQAHWQAPDGRFWPDLERVIHDNDNSQWKALVWHQGAQESFTTPEDTSVMYLGNLTQFVKSVRHHMCAANNQNEDGTCKDDGRSIPVLIVQLGAWPTDDRAERVRQAQAEYVAGDASAALVTTRDLGRFFHYDVLSFLIMGDRIAAALDGLWATHPDDTDAAAVTISSTLVQDESHAVATQPPPVQHAETPLRDAVPQKENPIEVEQQQQQHEQQTVQKQDPTRTAHGYSWMASVMLFTSLAAAVVVRKRMLRTLPYEAVMALDNDDAYTDDDDGDDTRKGLELGSNNAERNESTIT